MRGLNISVAWGGEGGREEKAAASFLIRTSLCSLVSACQSRAQDTGVERDTQHNMPFSHSQTIISITYQAQEEDRGEEEEKDDGGQLGL